MVDVMEQLRAARPMPRGERLAAEVERGRSPNEGYRPRVTRHAERTWMKWWRRSYTLNVYRHDIRAHAAPRALARERRRRERAERIAEERRIALFQAWADEQATSAVVHERGREIEALRSENAALRAEVEALRAGHTCREGDRVDCLACDANMRRMYLPPPPTREEVERALDAFEDALDAFDVVCISDGRGSAVDAANGRLVAAREALLTLATRRKP